MGSPDDCPTNIIKFAYFALNHYNLPINVVQGQDYDDRDAITTR